MAKSLTMFVNKADKTIRPLSLEEFLFILDDFPDQLKLTVTIEPFIRKVEMSQMGLFHAYIKIMSQETGQEKPDLKIEMKKKYGATNDDGSLKSTSNYSTIEMNTLIEGTYLFMTEFLQIHVPTPEEWKTKNLK